MIQNSITGGALFLRNYIPKIRRMEAAMPERTCAGLALVDVGVNLYDSSYKVDSSEMAFKIAATIGFKEACKKAENQFY